MDFRNSKLVVILVIVLSIAVSITIVLNLASSTDHADCKLVGEKPSAKKTNNVVSDALDSIANFDGFFHYQLEPHSKKPDEVYMQSTLKSIKLKETPVEFSLSLDADCLKINLELEQIYSWKRVNRIDIELVLPNGKDTKCSVFYPIIYWEPEKHYFCEEQKLYECYSVDGAERIVGTLVVNRLEFETHSSSRKFTTLRSACS